MDRALLPDFSKSETDSDLIIKLFFSYLSPKVMTFDKIWGLKLKN